MDLSTATIAATTATFFLAGIVKGVTGMGLPTVAMGVLGALISPLAAANLLIVPSMITNVWQLLAGPSLAALLLRLWPMMLAVLAATVAASSLLAAGSRTGLATGALGAALVAYAAVALLAWQPHIGTASERWLSPLVGAVTGAVTGATGVFVLPAVPYLQALALPKDDLVQALGLSFTVSTLGLAIGLATRGAFEPGHLAVSSLALVPALGGMWVGQAIRDKVSPRTFRRWFLICLLLLGAEMLTRPWR